MQKQTGIVSLHCFYKPDLNIMHYKYVNESTYKELWKKKTSELEYYFICLVYSGALEYSFQGKNIRLNENEFVICKLNEPCKIDSLPNVDSRYCIICFSGKLFNDEEFSLLRAFNNRASGQDNIYSIEKMTNSVLVKNLFYSFSEYIKKNLNKAHCTSLLKMFISEICIEFDKTHTNDVEKYSNEYDLRIYDYICQNFNQNITANSVAEHFFVSKWYVNNICHRFYRLPFKQMITDMRMWYARGLIMRNPNIRLIEVSQLCGYKEYSAFFKAYQNYFHITPKEDYKKFLRVGSFGKE